MLVIVQSRPGRDGRILAVFYLVLTPLGIAGTSAFPRSFWILEGPPGPRPRPPLRGLRPVRASAPNWRAHEGRGCASVTSSGAPVRRRVSGTRWSRGRAQRGVRTAGLEPVGFLDGRPVALKGKAGRRIDGDPAARTRVAGGTFGGVIYIRGPPGGGRRRDSHGGPGPALHDAAEADGPSVRRVTRPEFRCRVGRRFGPYPRCMNCIDGTVDGISASTRSCRGSTSADREDSRLGPRRSWRSIRDRCVLAHGLPADRSDRNFARQVSFAIAPGSARPHRSGRISPFTASSVNSDALALAGRAGPWLHGPSGELREPSTSEEAGSKSAQPDSHHPRRRLQACDPDGCPTHQMAVLVHISGARWRSLTPLSAAGYGYVRSRIDRPRLSRPREKNHGGRRSGWPEWLVRRGCPPHWADPLSSVRFGQRARVDGKCGAYLPGDSSNRRRALTDHAS
jgi:hypothetical protein